MPSWLPTCRPVYKENMVQYPAEWFDRIIITVSNSNKLSKITFRVWSSRKGVFFNETAENKRIWKISKFLKIQKLQNLFVRFRTIPVIEHAGPLKGFESVNVIGKRIACCLFLIHFYGVWRCIFEFENGNDLVSIWILPDYVGND